MTMTTKQRQKNAEGATLIAKVLRHAADGADIVRDGLQGGGLSTACMTEMLDLMSASLVNVREGIEDLKRAMQIEEETP